MYSTCIFCHSSLGQNQAIEYFPVGRRLAFDSAKGRLWAVCAKCGRWNLTPLEERWEAIEECERQFRGTILRSSTDQIGLARIKEGTDLIRIGQPLRPEFAAWRYGKSLQSRRRMIYLTGGITAAVVGGSLVFGSMPLIGLAGPLFGWIRIAITRKDDLGRAREMILRHAREGFGRKVKEFEHVDIRVIPSTEPQRWGLRFALDGKYIDHHGRDALHMANLVAPAVNKMGASAAGVRTAVQEIEDAGSPEKYFTRALNFGEKQGWKFTGIAAYPEHLRLAFEMAAHEESERIAVEGELAQLEADWREAEEVASIADNLFVPRAVSEFIDRHRRKKLEA